MKWLNLVFLTISFYWLLWVSLILMKTQFLWSHKPMKTPERWRALPRRPACQYSCPIDLLTQTFHTLHQLIMTDRQRPFNYPNENDHLNQFFPDVKAPNDTMTSRCDVMWRHDVTVWLHMTSLPPIMTWHYNYVMTDWIYTGHHFRNFKNNVFHHGDLNLWSMTLTFELIREMVEIHLSTKFWVRISNGSDVRVLTDTQTHTQTDGTDFIPSTADAGGKNEAEMLYMRVRAKAPPVRGGG